MSEPIEGIIINYLNRVFSDSNQNIKAYAQEPEHQIPSGEPAKFLVVEKTGSSKTNYLYSSMITIQSYAGSIYEAALLNERVLELMNDAVELDRITGIELNSTYIFTKTATKQPRYQAVFDVLHY